MDSWTCTETDLLIKLYNDDKLELLEICRIMKKKCKVIITKLLELGIVKSKNDVRGTNLEPAKPTQPAQPIPTQSTQSANPTQPVSNTVEQDNTWSAIKILNNINLVVGEISKVCASYTNLVEQVNKLDPEKQKTKPN